MKLVRALVLLPACLVALAGAGCADGEGSSTVDEPVVSEPATTESRRSELPPFSRLEGITTAEAFVGLGDEGLARWQDDVPRIQDVDIRSTADGSEQPALWLSPRREGAPLLVVLHSWSSGYLQHADIPFAVWAEEHGWAMIHPDFRGVNERPQSTGSDLAVQDVVDAIDFALGQAEIDEERVFVVGFSGGGMMSLLVAGRHPDRFAGAVAWVPVYDIVDWYRYNRDSHPERAYAGQIVASCGGDPSNPGDAQDACRDRSPGAHLGGARRVGLPIYIGHGIGDDLVPVDHSARAFDQLADPGDKLGPSVAEALRENRLPESLRGSIETETYFGGGDPEVVFARASGDVTLVLFDGTHNMVYHPGLAWMDRIARTP